MECPSFHAKFAWWWLLELTSCGFEPIYQTLSTYAPPYTNMRRIVKDRHVRNSVRRCFFLGEEKA